MSAPDFQQLHAWLTAWYVRGDRAAGHRFSSHELLPALHAKTRTIAPPADRQDCVQEVAEKFLDRDSMPGLDARGRIYWRRWYANRIIEFLRRRGRLPVPTEVVPAPEPAASRDLEARLIRLIAAGGRDARAALRQDLDQLAPLRRVCFMLYHHHYLWELAQAEEYAVIESRSGRGAPAVDAFLAALPPETDTWSYLPLVYSEADLAADPRKCFEGFGKACRNAAAQMRDLWVGRLG